MNKKALNIDFGLGETLGEILKLKFCNFAIGRHFGRFLPKIGRNFYRIIWSHWLLKSLRLVPIKIKSY